MSSETTRLQMSLVQPAQAQKHVTVNEALMRLDGMVGLTLESVTQPVPPAAVLDGQCWGVPAQAQAEWAGRSGQIAIGANGGWVFVPPARGMRAFLRDRGLGAIHDGGGWVPGAVTLDSAGGGMLAGMAEGEVVLGAGSTITTGIFIPAGAMVIGAVARVTAAITGSVTTWRMGTAGATNRFGGGLGRAQDSWARGILGAPMTYYQTEPVLLTAESGSFTGGRIRISVHWWELRLPQ